jgi:threonine/homoserine efflux transporter RhtA
MAALKAALILGPLNTPGFALPYRLTSLALRFQGARSIGTLLSLC